MLYLSIEIYIFLQSGVDTLKGLIDMMTAMLADAGSLEIGSVDSAAVRSPLKSAILPYSPTCL